MRPFHVIPEFCVLVILVSVIPFSVNATALVRETVIPNDKDSLSLWLIARTGWVYCARAAEYMEESEEQFNEHQCKQCYETLYHDHINEPENVTDADVLQCARNFENPGTTFPREPLRSNGVRAYLCNPEIRDTPTGVFGLRESFADPYRKFSAKNEPNQDYSRRSYIRCLMGKIYETEFAMCTPNRRKCAEAKKHEDEDTIFSTAVPIHYRLN